MDFHQDERVKLLSKQYYEKYQINEKKEKP